MQRSPFESRIPFISWSGKTSTNRRSYIFAFVSKPLQPTSRHSFTHLYPRKIMHRFFTIIASALLLVSFVAGSPIKRDDVSRTHSFGITTEMAYYCT